MFQKTARRETSREVCQPGCGGSADLESCSSAGARTYGDCAPHEGKKIGLKLKESAPANKTIMVTLANGAANSGYIYSDDAFNHLTFQVIGSRLKPGCAEGKIISTAIGLMRKSGE